MEMQETAIATTETAELVKVEDITKTTYVQGDINTYDITVDEGKIDTLAAINNAESLAEQGAGFVINLVDLVTMPGTRKSRTPGVPDTPCTNCYLIDRDGTAYVTQSSGIEKSVRAIMALYPDAGKSRESGCLTLVVIEKVLPNGNTYKTVTPVKVG